MHPDLPSTDDDAVIRLASPELTGLLVALATTALLRGIRAGSTPAAWTRR